jgi:hypothetical protein
MLRLARTAALVCCDREIGGMAERPVRAGSVHYQSMPRTVEANDLAEALLVAWRRKSPSLTSSCERASIAIRGQQRG